MPKKLDLTNMRFGRLLAIHEDGKNKWGAVLWKCKCDCGSVITTRGSNLIQEKSKSCGCLKDEIHLDLKTTHGMSGTPIYRRWRAMLNRCLSKSHKAYKNYGGRGIKVCDRWMSFEHFYEDMKEGFEGNKELDRKDNDDDYTPENCRWVSRKKQQRNRRNNHRIKFRGVTLTLVEWEQVTGIKANTILTRIRRGWPVRKALTTDPEGKPHINLDTWFDQYKEGVE